MVMLESLHEHFPEAHIYILCLSGTCYTALISLNYSYVTLFQLSDLEQADPELASVRATRSLVEYYFTITPCFPRFLLTQLNLDAVTYLDADMMFFSSPAPLFAEADDASVIITPHRFSSNLTGWECHGLYNVSWMTFRRTEQGIACLEWYRNACLDWCYDRMEEGRFADQKYLDYFAELFEGVHVIHHPGGGIAPWNIQDAVVEMRDEHVLVNGMPLLFYHAQGMKHIWGPFYASGFLGYGAANNAAREYILAPYVQQYDRAVRICEALVSGGDFFGVRITAPHAFWEKAKQILKECIKRSLVVRSA
jgi:hypothetical protein